MPRSPLLDHSRAERLALVDMFASLDEAQLATQSLCAAWTVRDVLAHLATPALLSNADIAKQFLRKPSFHAATVAWSERLASSSTEELIDGLRRTADDPFIPPVVGPAGPLTDAVILSTLVDGTMLVVRAFKTPKDMVRHALRSLVDVGANTAGLTVSNAARATIGGK